MRAPPFCHLGQVLSVAVSSRCSCFCSPAYRKQLGHGTTPYAGRSATPGGLSNSSLTKSTPLPSVTLLATALWFATPSKPHQRRSKRACVLRRTLSGRSATRALATARTSSRESLPHRPKTSTPRL